MSMTIDEYIEALREALRGSDPALIQDALYDAEEFLRSEIEASTEEDAETAIAHAVERYGSPEEVASAYRDADVTPGPHPPVSPRSGSDQAPVASRSVPAVASGISGLHPFFGVVADPQAWAALFYMLLSMVTGIIYFTWAITGISLSVGLIILIIGIPFILLFLASTRALSLVEGWIVEALLGVRMPRRPRISTGEVGMLERIKYWLSDYRTWTTLLYMVLMLPLGVIYFSVAITLLALGLALMASPVIQLATDYPFIHFDGYSYYVELWMFPFVLVLGALIILLTLHLARGVGKVHGGMAKVLLVGRL
ncbi:sensor domain-containing protein [Gemmatimonadota bacterium]